MLNSALSIIAAFILIQFCQNSSIAFNDMQDKLDPGYLASVSLPTVKKQNDSTSSTSQPRKNLSVYPVAIIKNKKNSSYETTHVTKTKDVTKDLSSNIIKQEKLENNAFIDIKKVKTTPKIKQTTPKFVIGKLGSIYNDLSTQNNITYKNHHYYYGSQLIAQSTQKQVFTKHKLNLHDKNGNSTPYWKRYHQKKGDKAIDLYGIHQTTVPTGKDLILKNRYLSPIE